MLAGSIDFAAVRMQYWFEKKQVLRFSVLDCGTDNIIGSYEVTLGKIMGSKAQIHKGLIDLIEIIIRATTPQEAQPAAKLTF